MDAIQARETIKSLGIPPQYMLHAPVYYTTNAMKPRVVKRTFRERWFSLPWTPWNTTKLVMDKMIAYLPQYGIVAHPSYKPLVDEIRKVLGGE